jgi:hypothetical protein
MLSFKYPLVNNVDDYFKSPSWPQRVDENRKLTEKYQISYLTIRASKSLIKKVL